MKLFKEKFKILITVFIVLDLFFLSAQNAFAIPSMQQRCEPSTACVIGEYIFNNDGYTPITTANYCQITITDPSDVVIVNGSNISNKTDGWHYYSTSSLSTEGLYRATMCCGTAPERLCMDKSFVVGTSFNNLPEKIWSYTGSALDTVGNAISKVWSYATRQITSRQIGSGSEYIAGVTSATTVAQVANEADQTIVKYNVELIRGATFDFAGFADSGTTLTLVDSELDQPNDYWNDYRLKMMSGSNVGEERTVSDFDATLDTITVSSAFTNSVANGDKYVLLHEDRLVYKIWNYSARTLTGFGTLVADVSTSVWANSTRTLSSFGTLASDVWSVVTRRLTDKTLTDGGSLATESYVDTAKTDIIAEVNENQTLVSSIRDSQQKEWTIHLSDLGQILAGTTYRAKLSVLNYESTPTDPFTIPTIVIYDADRNIVASGVAMTKLSDGIYEYTYSIPASPATGVWEAEASVEVESEKIIKANDYFEVDSSPAQVRINSITDNTVSSIVANTTITNEGTADNEYQYEYCIVDSLENVCGGGDDVDYAMGAKLINAGQDWITNMSLTANNIGTYYFKLAVYWGTERSVAVRQFDATAVVTPPSGGGGGGGGGGTPPPIVVVPGVCSGADFDHDGIVNSVDFSILLYFWKTQPPFKNSCVDVNKDAQVDSVDFSILLYQWGKSGININN